MARVTKKKIIKLTPAEIGKLKKPELRELLRGARQLYQTQEKTFKRYEGKVYSPSLEKMQSYYEESSKPLSRMNMNEMRSEMFRLQEFFEAKTSTVPGARKVTADMARRVFGEDSRGRPKKNFTTDEWSDFWSLYEEYKKMRPADVFEQSGMVQQMLAQVMLSDEDLKDNKSELLAVLRGRINSTRELSSWEMVDDEGDEVFSGTRPY